MRSCIVENEIVFRDFSVSHYVNYRCSLLQRDSPKVRSGPEPVVGYKVITS